MRMTRGDIVLAALAAADEDRTYTPVQVQKLFFLIDEECSTLLGGRKFRFRPYSYGPFDPEVYRELERLQDSGKVVIRTDGGGGKLYGLTVTGKEDGDRLLDVLGEDITAFLHSASRFVHSLGFSELVSSIYQAYPQMKKNSVFRTVSAW